MGDIIETKEMQTFILNTETPQFRLETNSISLADNKPFATIKFDDIIYDSLYNTLYIFAL